MENTTQFLLAVSIITSVLIAVYFIFIRKNNSAKNYPEAETNNKLIKSPKFARYDYEFSNGIKCFQEELSYNQDKRLAELIVELNIKDFSELKVNKVIELLTVNDLLEKFFGIIFHVNLLPKNATFSQLKNSEIERALTDFFILNPSAKKLLQILNVAAVFTNQDLSAKTANG